MSRRIVLGIIALLVPLAAAAQTVGGSYTVAGANPDGAPYTGVVEIALTSEECTVTWAFGNGGAAGNCLLAEGVLATSYVTDGVVTLVLYRVQTDGVLSGEWRVASMAGMGTEILTPK